MWLVAWEDGIEIFKEDEIVASITVDGFFKKIQGDHYTGHLDISGFYSGPESFNAIDEYTLQLNPEGNTKLTGTFDKTVFGDNGEEYLIKSTQKYLFHDGVTKPLESFIAKISFDTDKSYIDLSQKYIYMSGFAEIQD